MREFLGVNEYPVSSEIIELAFRYQNELLLFFKQILRRLIVSSFLLIITVRLGLFRFETRVHIILFARNLQFHLHSVNDLAMTRALTACSTGTNYLIILRR
jgi:hypothetical protein